MHRYKQFIAHQALQLQLICTNKNIVLRNLLTKTKTTTRTTIRFLAIDRIFFFCMCTCSNFCKIVSALNLRHLKLLTADFLSRLCIGQQ